MPIRLHKLRWLFTMCMLCGYAGAQDTSHYSLSIYNETSEGSGPFSASIEPDARPGGYAVVRDLRQFDLKAGSNAIQIRDMPRYLDAGAISFRALNDPEGVLLTHQTFEFDPITLDRLVERHIGHRVVVEHGDGVDKTTMVGGTLLSNTGGLSLRLDSGQIVTVTEFSRVSFPDLPHGLSATPTLSWQIDAKKAGPQTIELAYPTEGLAWRAEYSAWLLNGAECKTQFSAWAAIANHSGSDFRNARVKLIAGDPHRLNEAKPATRLLTAAKSRAARPQESLLGDFHEYTLDAAIDIANASIQRVALFPAQTVTCSRQYLFEPAHLRLNPETAPITDRNYGLDSRTPVRSTLALRLDRALPGGRLRVLVDDGDHAPEFIGEDAIAHTPANETLAVELGNAFDLKGERTQTDYQINKDARTLNESFAIRLTNGSAQPQNVVVREHLYRWSQWNIVQSSTKFEKRNADTIDFKLEVPANGTITLSYTIQYQWTANFQ